MNSLRLLPRCGSSQGRERAAPPGKAAQLCLARSRQPGHCPRAGVGGESPSNRSDQRGTLSTAAVAHSPPGLHSHRTEPPHCQGGGCYKVAFS